MFLTTVGAFEVQWPASAATSVLPSQGSGSGICPTDIPRYTKFNHKLCNNPKSVKDRWRVGLALETSATRTFWDFVEEVIISDVKEENLPK